MQANDSIVCGGGREEGSLEEMEREAKERGTPYTMSETFWIYGSSPSIDQSEISSTIEEPTIIPLGHGNGNHIWRYLLQLEPLPFHSLRMGAPFYHRLEVSSKTSPLSIPIKDVKLDLQMMQT